MTHHNPINSPNYSLISITFKGSVSDLIFIDFYFCFTDCLHFVFRSCFVYPFLSCQVSMVRCSNFWISRLKITAALDRSSAICWIFWRWKFKLNQKTENMRTQSEWSDKLKNQDSIFIRMDKKRSVRVSYPKIVTLQK